MHFNLKALAQRFGIGANVLFTVPWNLYRGLREDEMNIIYNCMDVYFTLSRHEGFALPVLEAQACSVPVIASTLTSHIELVEKTGWLVKPAVKDLSPMLEYETVSDEFHAAELLGKAYNSREELQRMGRIAHEFALAYDYEKLVAEKWLPFFRECEEEIKA
jgi:glycosyltransferase involved in cell wall biosynthesis